MKLGYLGIDQYGKHYRMKTHPRKELCEQLGCKSSVAKRMFVDRKKDGTPKHIGYVVGDLWVTVYEVHEWAHSKE